MLHQCQYLRSRYWAFSLIWAVTLTAVAEDSIREQIDSASKELTYYNFDRAYEQFESIREHIDAVGSADWQRVTFGLACAAQSKVPATPENIAEAQKLYEELIEHAAGTRFEPRAIMAIGRLADVRHFDGDITDVDTARSCYRKVIENWPDQPIASEAMLRLGDTWVRDNESPSTVRQGLEMIESWVIDHPDSPYASIMWEYLGHVYQSYLNEPSRTLDCYLRAVEAGLIESTASNQIFWNIAEIAREAGKLELAVAYYQRLIRETPRSGRVFEARGALIALKEANPGMDVEIPPLESNYRLPANYSDLNAAINSVAADKELR